MRILRSKRLLVYAASACFVVLLMLKLKSVGLLMSTASMNGGSSSNRKMPSLRDSGSSVAAAGCQVSEGFASNLRRLMTDTDATLSKLNLMHPLCYGTLWGWLKMERLLPWADNVKFCVLNDELVKHEEAFLIRAFRRVGLVLSYDSRNGVYEVRRSSAVAVAAAAADDSLSGDKKSKNDVGAVVRLVVFERHLTQTGEAMMKRVGWARRVLPPDCELSPSLQCFPARLVEQPLPTAVIDDVAYSVPREEVEIQKYHYPNTWWEDVRPADC